MNLWCATACRVLQCIHNTNGSHGQTPFSNVFKLYWLWLVVLLVTVQAITYISCMAWRMRGFCSIGIDTVSTTQPHCQLDLHVWRCKNRNYKCLLSHFDWFKIKSLRVDSKAKIWPSSWPATICWQPKTLLTCQVLKLFYSAHTYVIHWTIVIIDMY